jgi:hypothetical protein
MKKKIFAVFLLLIFAFAFAGGADAASCRLVSGKTYYTDGVSYFKDAKCQQEMTTAQLNASSGTTSNTSAITGSCRYNYSKMQYTDGVSFFTDNKCSKEALNGETAPEPGVNAAAQTQVSAASAGAISTLQFTALFARIDALEKRVAILQSILSQILALLLKK